MEPSKETKEAIAKIYSDGFSNGAAMMLDAAQATVERYISVKPNATGAEIAKLVKELQVPK